MDIDMERLAHIVASPAESLNIELKAWIDPTSDEGREKVVRAALALRNRNGGYLVIGIDDKTRDVATGGPTDARALWKEDELQALVARYASDPFPLALRFPPRNGVELPLIAVPSGVQTPVALKRPLGRHNEGAIFFRTLRSGGVVSTSIARATDWPDIVRICFDNRDADVASFIRRHFSDVDVASLAQILGKPFKADPTLHEQTLSVRLRGEERFERAKPEAPKIRVNPDLGAFEVAMQISPSLMDRVADQALRSMLAASDPAFGGMALWYEAPALGAAGLPKQQAGGWESLIVSESFWDVFDFMRVEPTGGFYQHRLIETDAAAYQRGAKPGVALEPGVTLQSVAESVAAGLAFARGLECDPDTTRLGFAFRWTGLAERRLVDWVGDLMIFAGEHKKLGNDPIESFVEVPLNTQLSAIAPLAQRATRELFAAFNGYVFRTAVAEHRITARLSRR